MAATFTKPGTLGDERIPFPFAIGDAEKTEISNVSDPYKLNRIDGIPVACEVPVANGGVAFDRHMFNSLAYQATIGGFLLQIGYGITFNQAVCDKIGGYPKGAVLKDFSMTFDDTDTSDSRIVRNVISLQPNNTKNFCAGEDNPDPYVVGTEVDGKVWWKYVDDSLGEIEQVAPDVFNRTGLAELSGFAEVKDGKPATEEFESTFDGWITITFKVENFVDYLNIPYAEEKGLINFVVYQLVDSTGKVVMTETMFRFETDFLDVTVPTYNGYKHRFSVYRYRTQGELTIGIYSAKSLPWEE